MNRMPSPGSVAVLALFAASLAFRPDLAHAQHVEGVVREIGGARIGDVYIAVVDESREVVTATLSDDDGAFRLNLPGSGEYYLRVTLMGYRPLFDGPYRISARSPLEASVVMHPLPIELDSLRVDVPSGRVARLTAVGYYERKEKAFGHFYERDEIQRVAPIKLADLFRRVPRVVVQKEMPGQLNPSLVLKGGAGFCRPTVYLDGAMAAQGGVRPVVPDDMVAPSDVEAVEVYTGSASVPLQFQSRSSCGVILIWTRHTPLER